MSGSSGGRFESGQNQSSESKSEHLERQAEGLERGQAVSELDKGTLNDRQRNEHNDRKEERKLSLGEQIQKTGMAKLGVITKAFGESISITKTDEKTGHVQELVRGRSKEEVAAALKQMSEASDKGLMLGAGGSFVDGSKPIEETLKKIKEDAIKAGAPEELFAINQKASEYKIKYVAAGTPFEAANRTYDPESVLAAGPHAIASDDSMPDPKTRTGAEDRTAILQGHVVVNEVRTNDAMETAKAAMTMLSEQAGRIAGDGISVGKAIDLLKEAVGLNEQTKPPEAVHAPTGDFSTLPRGVQNAGDILQVGAGTTAGYVQSVNEIVPLLSPQGAGKMIEAAPQFVQEFFRKDNPAEAADFLRRQIDPIYTVQQDAQKVADVLTDWANHRSRESFGERGQDAGSVAFDLSPLESGFILAGKAARANQVAEAIGRKVKDVEKMTSSELAEHAERVGIEIQKIERVNGRLPLNWEFAGRNFTFEEGSKYAREHPQKAKQLAESYPLGVHFNLKGFPEFEPYARRLPDGEKVITEVSLTGDIDKDFDLANAKFGWTMTPTGHTWHHHEDARTMILVPTKLHEAVRHTGGQATSGLPYNKKGDR